MTRWAVAGCMALATLGAMAVLDVGSATAEAAPSVSPFAGSYVGADPQGWNGSWAVTISDGGQIKSSFSKGPRGLSGGGSITGQVGADGGYSFTVSRKRSVFEWRIDGGPLTVSYKSAGKMALNDGNIVGTARKNGGSFVWLRQ